MKRVSLTGLACLWLLAAACPADVSERAEAGAPRELIAEAAAPRPLSEASLALVVRGRDGVAGDPVALAVENAGERPAFLRRAIAVEVAGPQGWQILDPPARGLYLRRGCAADPRPGLLVPPGFSTSCVEIKAGASFTAEPWLGGHGDGQCACDKCYPVGPGNYRFVAQTCDGQRTIYGEPFRLRGLAVDGE